MEKTLSYLSVQGCLKSSVPYRCDKCVVWGKGPFRANRKGRRYCQNPTEAQGEVPNVLSWKVNVQKGERGTRSENADYKRAVVIQMFESI